MVVTQSCPTLCDPMDCSLPGSSVHRIFQARILEWLLFPPPGEYSQPRAPTHISCVSHTAGRFFTGWAIREAPPRPCFMFSSYLALAIPKTLSAPSITLLPNIWWKMSLWTCLGHKETSLFFLKKVWFSKKEDVNKYLVGISLRYTIF